MAKAKKAKTAKKAKRARKEPAVRAAKSTGAARKAKRGSQKRELLKRGNKNVAFAKRRGDGTFKENDEVSRSLAADRRQKAKAKAKRGYGDRGDR